MGGSSLAIVRRAARGAWLARMVRERAGAVSAALSAAFELLKDVLWAARLFSDTFGHEVCEYVRNSCKGCNRPYVRLFAYSLRFNSVFAQSITSSITGSNPVRVALAVAEREPNGMRTSVRAERSETDNHAVIARKGVGLLAAINPVRVATHFEGQIAFLQMNRGSTGVWCDKWQSAVEGSFGRNFVTFCYLAVTSSGSQNGHLVFEPCFTHHPF